MKLRVDGLVEQGARWLAAGDAALLRQWAGRHPYYLQLLAHHLVEAHRLGLGTQKAMDDFQTEANTRLRELWRVLDERERAELHHAAFGLPSKRRSLRQRGLATEEEKPFGEVLTAWIKDQS